ncbi:hypothetical protein GCM10010236_75480 [Streptomyces eurythermus]|nr:hypothetical protein GCM10010236_75480 [Streptomyces eurythermus]
MPEVGEGLEDRAGVAELLGVVERHVPYPQARETRCVGEAGQFGVAGQVGDAEGLAGGLAGTQPGGAPVVVEGQFETQGRQARGVHEPVQGGRSGGHGQGSLSASRGGRSGGGAHEAGRDGSRGRDLPSAPARAGATRRGGAKGRRPARAGR